jgi:hypothetical protein
MTYKILPFSGSSDLGAMHALALIPTSIYT